MTSYRTKFPTLAGSETNRKSYYNAPRVKLFGGSLVEYIRESGQPIPRIITSCVKTINRHGFCHQGIFRVNGLQAELNKLQEAFEAGEDPLVPASLSDELDFDINSIAGLLKVNSYKFHFNLKICSAIFENLKKKLYPRRFSKPSTKPVR